MSLSPIVLFVFKRLEETKKTIEALKKNYLASESRLIIYSDYGRNEDEIKKVLAVREYINSVSGFKSIKIILAENNNGLAKSIIKGVSDVINEFGKVIVLEDDLLTTPNFLDYMNYSLNYYLLSKKVFSISGYSHPIPFPSDYNYDAAFGYRSSSWGWATWEDRWNKIDWDLGDYHQFIKDRKRRKMFNRGGDDLCRMLKRQHKGIINSWAIRWCYHQFKNDLYDIFPRRSKVENIGFGEGATHCDDKHEYFAPNMDNGDSREFKLSSDVEINNKIVEEFRNIFSNKSKIIFKMKSVFPKVFYFKNH